MKAYTVAVNAAETSLVSPIRGIVSFSVHNQPNVRLRRLFPDDLVQYRIYYKAKRVFFPRDQVRNHRQDCAILLT